MRFKKRVTKSKESGDIDEKESDPMFFSLYEYLRKFSVEESNMFYLEWAITQWNCTKRPTNIEPLRLHRITPYENCIKAKFESNKSDQTGERCLPKKSYGNVFNP